MKLLVFALIPLLVAGTPLISSIVDHFMAPVKSVVSNIFERNEATDLPVTKNSQPGFYSRAQPYFTNSNQYRPAASFMTAYRPAASYVPAYRPVSSYMPAYRPASSYMPAYRPAAPGNYVSAPAYGPSKPTIVPITSNAIDGEDSQAGGHEGESHAAGPHFGYSEEHGPDTWRNDFPACGGSRQSPIDIRSADLESRAFSEVVRENYWTPPDTMVVENNGHTLEVDGVWPKGKEPTITGGPLKSKYQFKQMHFHWGEDQSTGSEHTVNGKSMPMEMHVVHFNLDYGTYEEALKHEDGLAVVAYFIDVTDQHNPMFDKFIYYTNRVGGSEAREVEMKQTLPLGILDLDCPEYVSYEGSLTTPPCLEIVTWMVCTKYLTISEKQLHELSTVVTDGATGGHIHNYRPPQPLNGRHIYMSTGSA